MGKHKRINKLRRLRRVSKAWIKTANINNSISMLKMGENLSQIEAQRPGFIEALVKSNRDLQIYLEQWDIAQYIGSGSTGDVWLLKNGLTLKIFDNNIHNDLRKYIDISNVMFADNEEDQAYARFEPMVHGYGTLEVPKGYEDVLPALTNKRIKRRKDSYSPVFVISEKIKTLKRYVDEYFEKNPVNMGYPGQYAEEEESHRYMDRLLDSLPDAIKRIPSFYGGYGAPEWLVKDINYHWINKGKRPTVQDVTMHFVERVISIFTLRFIKDKFKQEFLPSLSTDSEVTASPFGVDESGVKYIDKWAKEIAEDVDRGLVIPPTTELRAAANLIGISHSKDWIEALARTTLAKLARGHGDLHFENLGRRSTDEQDTSGDSDFVYFDS